jgi:hypothetical protein
MFRPFQILFFIGYGTCSGADGVGVQCIAYDKDGNPQESGGTCSRS